MGFFAEVEGLFDRIVGGRGEFSITVPVMDGPLKPNDILERGARAHSINAIDSIAWVPGGLLATARGQIFAIDPKTDAEPVTRLRIEGDISCLAVSGKEAMAVGIDGVGIRIVGGQYDGALIRRTESGALNCPTAVVFFGDDTIVVANGSAENVAAAWSRDLMTLGCSGVVSMINLASGTAKDLGTNLRFPSGLCLDPSDGDRLYVSESWKHQVVALDLRGTPSLQPILSELPAYPGRLVAAAGGGFWLACFAVRSQLQEFVLREHRFRRRMVEEVDPRFWIAPALASGKSFKEPLQAGGVIRLGVHKPWAPTRSYGLVVRLDQNLQPLWSAHSRANGTRHGITSVVEHDDRLFVVSKGRGEIFTIENTIPRPSQNPSFESRPA